MNRINIMIVGFGGVGQAFTSILSDQCSNEKKNNGLEYRLVAVADLRHGWAYDEDGLDLTTLLNVDKRSDILVPFGKDPNQETLELIRRSGLDVLVEASYTTHDGEPAISYFKEAIRSGAHVVTTNKGPIALASSELECLAQKYSASISAEGTVMSGTPVLSVLNGVSATTNITKIRGIFNGTSNYILTMMGEGMAYADALKQAQDLGYAEADPKNDVEGWDVAMKMLILSNMYMGTSYSLDDIIPTGITGLTRTDIEKAETESKRWKLIGEITKTEDGANITVKPILLGNDDPLMNIMGATNAINVECDYLKSFTISGPGAGRFETGYSLWLDMHIACLRGC